MGHDYPVFISLAGCHCLVVGLGAVGRRKLASLLGAGAERVLALDLRSLEDLGRAAHGLLTDRRVIYEQRPWREADARDSLLVFACTGDRAENDRIAAFCQEHRILCNNVTAPEKGAFVVPAVAAKGGICCALGTGGQSPLLARQWRDELETWLEPRSRMAWVMGRLRRPIIALGWPQERNRELFATIADPVLGGMLISGDLTAARHWLQERLPQPLHRELKHIFTEFAHAFS